MSNAQHTPGPLRVLITGTCSAAWPEIVQDCVDPATGNKWVRELGRAETSHVETDDARNSSEMPDTYDVKPHRFELDTDGEEAIANAHLWASSPELLAALEFEQAFYDGEEWAEQRVYDAWAMQEVIRDTKAFTQAYLSDLRRAAISAAKGGGK